MKKFIFCFTAINIALSACGDSLTNSGEKVPEATTPLQIAAKGYCDCAKEADWNAIDMSDPNDPDAMMIMQKIMLCGMEVSRQHNLPLIQFNEDGDSIRNELILRCPDVIKKCDELGKLMTNNLFGNGG